MVMTLCAAGQAPLPWWRRYGHEGSFRENRYAQNDDKRNGGRNSRAFKKQFSRFLDFSEGKAMLVNNADWS